MAIIAADIDSAVKRAFPVEGIDALPEAAGHLALDRPKIRSGIGPVPVRRGSVAGHAQTNAYGRVAGQCGGAKGAKLVQRNVTSES